MLNFLPFFSGSKLPERFNFMPRQEQVEFVRIVTEYLQKNLPEAKLDLKLGRIIRDSDVEYGLDNLAQQYHQATKEERRTLVASHFEKMAKTKQEEEDLLKNVSDFEKMKPYLAVRLFPEDYKLLNGKHLFISKTDLEGTITMLVYDLPSSAVNVKPDHVTVWKKDINDLFEIATLNTLKKYPALKTSKKINDDITIWFLGGDNNVYVTSWIYNLENYPELIGDYGSLVIVPHRHALIAYPINDDSAMSTMNALLFIAQGIYKEGPGSITPNLFWYHDKKFTKIPYEQEGKKISVLIMPNTDLKEMLLKLPKKKE